MHNYQVFRLNLLIVLSFFTSFSLKAMGEISFETENLVIRTLSMNSLSDLHSVHKISRLSRQSESLKGLGNSIDLRDFLFTPRDLDKVRGFIKEHADFEVNMGVFYNNQIIGAISFSSPRALDYRYGLYNEGYAGYDSGRWLEYSRFVFPDFQGRGFGKEIANGNLDFAFNQLFVDGVVATAFKDNQASISSNINTGFKPAFSEFFDEILQENERLFYIKKTRFEARACLRILN